MRLCVVRHGIATERAAGVDDADRALTDASIPRTRAAIAGLATLISPEIVFTSPLKRAHQTASIAADVFGLPRAVECEALASGQHASLLATLREADASTVAIVGHEPWLSGLISLLVAGVTCPANLRLKKAGAALVEISQLLEPGTGSLLWLLPPTVLRQLGTG